MLDFIHLWVSAPERLVLLRRGSEGAPIGRLLPKLVLVVGDDLIISVEPFAADQQLVGDFDVQWSSGEHVLTVFPAGVEDWYRLRALSPGKVNLTAEALGLSTKLEVEVLP